MVNAPATLGQIDPGSLARYPNEDLTPHIGTLFSSPSTQLTDILASPDADTLVRDLATLISHRGVVFFKAQTIDYEQMRVLGTKLGKLSAEGWVGGRGQMKNSGLHRHPISESSPELKEKGEDDKGELSVISSMGGISRAGIIDGTRASSNWHADISFEKVPSDYAMLHMLKIPRTGGDTLWASGYEAYDRLSPAMQKFLEGMTAVHNADFFNEYARKNNIPIQDPRGAPENTGTDLTSIHPVIRTNPVTNFKSVYVNKNFTKRIPQLTKDESDTVLDYLFRHVSENHDLQVRYRWSQGDLAIWDNRSTYHTATNDYDAIGGDRYGERVVSLGETPFYDPASKSRREALGLF